MNNNSLLLNIEFDSDFLTVSSNLYQLFRVEGKEEFLKLRTTVKSWHTVYSCSSSLLNFWSQIDSVISFSFTI